MVGIQTRSEKTTKVKKVVVKSTKRYSAFIGNLATPVVCLCGFVGRRQLDLGLLLLCFAALNQRAADDIEQFLSSYSHIKHEQNVEAK